MKFVKVLFYYIKWHYTESLLKSAKFWKNLADFVFNFFSIKELTSSFFSPWKRMGEVYPKQFDIKQYLNIFLLNTIMRIVGIFLRSAIIFVGFVCWLLFIVLYIPGIILWTILPIAVLWLFLWGITLFFFG